MTPKVLLAENLDYLILVYSVSLILSLKKTEKTEQVEEKTGSLGPKPPLQHYLKVIPLQNCKESRKNLTRDLRDTSAPSADQSSVCQSCTAPIFLAKHKEMRCGSFAQCCMCTHCTDWVDWSFHRIGKLQQSEMTKL